MYENKLDTKDEESFSVKFDSRTFTCTDVI